MNKELSQDWIQIKEFPNYAVSSQGTVINMGTRKILKPRPNNKGYPVVWLSKCAGVIKAKFIHHLVLDTFRGKRPTENLQCNHKDGDKANNHISNLEWCTQAENMRHASKNNLLGKRIYKTGEQAPFVKLTRSKVKTIKMLLAMGDLFYKDIAPMFDVHRVTIGCIARGQTWSHTKIKIINSS